MSDEIRDLDERRLDDLVPIVNEFMFLRPDCKDPMTTVSIMHMADMIERLRTENERLRAELSRMKKRDAEWKKLLRDLKAFVL